MTNAEELVRRDLTEPNTIRLVSTAYIDEPAMTPLAKNDQELDILAEVEGLTSPRRTGRMPIPGGLDPAELLNSSAGYGWTYVNAAFCYTREEGSRFNSAERGAWYAAYGNSAVDTALEEVRYHLTRELIATNTFDNVTTYQELVAGFTANFHDLSDLPDADELSPEIEKGYPAGQRLARQIFLLEGNGLLYPSVRRPGGKCLAAFRPHMVQNVRPADKWKLEWSGTPNPAVTKVTNCD
ncbi:MULTISPECIES: RES family NAD+ phosphorylase [unclassified Labrenzia]|uniref:RES family NAD+ phosphorylase n=1 Tax=unclassified Labrenzia TaxID=2648686 RepID=UPI0012687B91|nr:MULTISPECIES: RES family NAD+ phosphorylase [unclassified Labrenzia]